MPSLSAMPTYPQEECSEDHAKFPFCYNGQGGGRFGYAACMVMTSSVNCGRYDFQIMGTNYSSYKPINFTKCSNVWTWFANCIAASFPTCRRTSIGIFRGWVPDSIGGPYERKITGKPSEWLVVVEGNGVNCKANCNEGSNRWQCRDIDEANGILAFARWVAGYRPGDKWGKPSQYALFTEPETSCKTSAPTHSAAPTSSPAPTIASAPMCADTGYPAHVTNPNSSVMSNNALPGARFVNVTKQCVYAIRANTTAPDETFTDRKSVV